MSLSNLPASFTTDECEWKRIAINILNRKIIGLLSFSFDTEITTEHLFAAGSQPIDIQEGNEVPTGSIGLLKYEFDKMNDAAQAAGYPSIIHVPHTLITITTLFKKYPTSPTRTITSYGVKFNKWTVGQQQNALKTEMNMPFLALKHVLS